MDFECDALTSLLLDSERSLESPLDKTKCSFRLATTIFVAFCIKNKQNKIPISFLQTGK